MSAELLVLAQFGIQLRALGWISDLLVAGSAATGDYVPGVSDLDLVAVTNGPVDGDRQAVLSSLHRQVDQSIGTGLQLGCTYIDYDQREPTQVPHPTWTHGVLVHRIVSAVTRAELVRYGYAVFGRAPQALFPSVTGLDIREAARAELDGYWAWAARASLDVARPDHRRSGPDLHGSGTSRTAYRGLAHEDPSGRAGRRAGMAGRSAPGPPPWRGYLVTPPSDSLDRLA
jgi:hypothetical protein